jgi:hypothetical protein
MLRWVLAFILNLLGGGTAEAARMAAPVISGADAPRYAEIRPATVTNDTLGAALSRTPISSLDPAARQLPPLG